MKIALLGSPGAGKSKLAGALARKHELRVVDNYVQKLQKSTGLALGPWATYPENLMIAGVRAAAEAKAAQSDQIITVGTVVDTLVYCAVRSDVDLHSPDPDLRNAAYQAASAAMAGVGMWYSQTWDYTLAFYLTNPKGDWDNAYNAVLENFHVPCIVLEGEHADRVKIASEIVDIAKREEQTAATQQALESPPAE
jgi:nicotinamide riboside kinase